MVAQSYTTSLPIYFLYKDYFARCNIKQHSIIICTFIGFIQHTGNKDHSSTVSLRQLIVFHYRSHIKHRYFRTEGYYILKRGSIHSFHHRLQINRIKTTQHLTKSIFICLFNH